MRCTGQKQTYLHGDSFVWTGVDVDVLQQGKHGGVSSERAIIIYELQEVLIERRATFLIIFSE